MSDKIRLKNKEGFEVDNEVVNRLIHIFPCVIWKDVGKIKKKKDYKGYFDHSDSGINFHNKLYNLIKSKVTDYTVVKSFYDFQKKVSNTEKTETPVDYILPPEKAFKTIKKNKYNTYMDSEYEKGGYYYLFNNCYIEQNFLKELSQIVQSSIPLDGVFPLCKGFGKWNDWICEYDSDHTRFKWDVKQEGWGVLHGTNPWKAFYHYCQFCYTLARIGFEYSPYKKNNMTDYYENGYNVISYCEKPSKESKKLKEKTCEVIISLIKSIKESKKSIKPKNCDDLKWNDYIHDVIYYSLEERYEKGENTDKKNSNKNLNIFHVNNLKETTIIIKKSIRNRLFLLKPFTNNECTRIKKIFTKYAENIDGSDKFDSKDVIEKLFFMHKWMNELEYELKEGEDRKNAEKALKNAKKTIERLYNKYKIKSSSALRDDSSTPKKQIEDDLEQKTMLEELIKYFCIDELKAPNEYCSWVKENSKDFYEAFKKLYTEEIEKFEDNILINKYAEICKVKIDKTLISAFKQKAETAAKYLVEKYK